MKKFMIFAVSLVILLSAQVCLGADYAVYDGFETSVGEAVPYYSNGKVVVEHETSGGANGSDGCLKVTANAVWGIKYPVSLVPGVTYKISAWVKFENQMTNQITVLGANGTSKPVDTAYIPEYKLTEFSDGTTYTEDALGKWCRVEVTHTAANTAIEEKYVGFRFFASSTTVSDAVIYVDDLKVEPVTVLSDAPAVSKVSVTEPLFAGETADWNCSSTGSKNRLVVLANKGKGDFIAYSGDAAADYAPDNSLKGASLQFVLIPSGNATVGLPYTYKLTKPVVTVFELTETVKGSVNDAKIQAKVDIISRKSEKNVLVMLCIYDANKAMIAMDEATAFYAIGDAKPIEVELDVPKDAADYRLFVWEGKSSLDTSLEVLN